MKLWRCAKLFLPALAAVGFFLANGCDNSAAMNQSTADVKHIAQAEFNREVLQSQQPVVVDFYATWCAPCRVLSPMLDRLAGGFTNQIKFVKVNVDEAQSVAEDYQIQGIPTVIFFKNGKEAGRFSEVPTESDLKNKLAAFAAAK